MVKLLEINLLNYLEPKFLLGMFMSFCNFSLFCCRRMGATVKTHSQRKSGVFLFGSLGIFFLSH